jgi:xanthine dehydrogenase molybdenum-binding subunit
VSDLAVIGRNTPKLDGPAKVTGACNYLPDMVLPRMAYGKILRTPVPHARIVSIDASRAKALPGVLGVITAADVEQHPFGFGHDHLALKTDRVRCIRDEVAAVAAESEAIAAEACRLIEVEYEELPGAFTLADAMAEGAHAIHDKCPDNRVPIPYALDVGDVDALFAKADVVVEDTYHYSFVTTAALGTMAAIAEWSPDGRLTMWSTTQVPFLYQKDLAQALGVSGDRIRVIQPPVGGNFGRGLDLYPIDVITAMLAKHVRRPVRIVFDRAEELLASPTREPCELWLRTAATKDGTLLARDAKVTIDAGAYISWGATTPYVMMSTVSGAYRVQGARFDSHIIYTNNPYSGSMRGYGNLEASFAVEAQMDELADACGLDRMEFRRRNANQPGDVTPQDYRITTCAFTECLDAVEAEIQAAAAEPAPPGRKRGVGYAGMFHVAGGARVYRSDGCGAAVKVDDFGHVTLSTGASEIGQGSETVLAMMVAETLTVPVDRITVVNDDTATTPWDVGVHASRTTFIAGNAAIAAAQKVRAQLIALGAARLEAEPAECDLVAGEIVVTADPSRRVAYDKAVRLAHYRSDGQVVSAEAFYDPPTDMMDGDFKGNVSTTYGFAAQAVLVEVDEATGQVEVLKLVSAHDVGRALNPMACEGQIEGGIHMGLGYALREELQVEAGHVRTASLMDYKLYTAPDMPELVVKLIDQPDPAGPFGAKGVGEAGVIPVAAAIGNAVRDATGVRMHQLPLTSERVYRALRDAAERS